MNNFFFPLGLAVNAPRTRALYSCYIPNLLDVCCTAACPVLICVQDAYNVGALEPKVEVYKKKILIFFSPSSFVILHIFMLLNSVTCSFLFSLAILAARYELMKQVFIHFAI